MKEAERTRKQYDKLVAGDLHTFPPKRTLVKVSSEQGVYIIYDSKNVILHVGRTIRAKNGLNQRLQNHLRGASSFARQYLKTHPSVHLRDHCTFRYLEIPNARQRALLESLATALLCPKHLGTGERYKY